jgi:hypothetical protein
MYWKSRSTSECGTWEGEEEYEKEVMEKKKEKKKLSSNTNRQNHFLVKKS